MAPRKNVGARVVCQIGQPLEDKLDAALRKLNPPEGLYRLHAPAMIHALLIRRGVEAPGTMSRRSLISTLSNIKERAAALEADFGAMSSLPFDWRVPILTMARMPLPRIAPGRAGAPAKTRGQNTARDAALFFHILTGHPATVITPISRGSAGGPFVEFLREIFQLLGIEDSPISQAKRACSFMREAEKKMLQQKS